jgi:hypothetical protein
MVEPQTNSARQDRQHYREMARKLRELARENWAPQERARSFLTSPHGTSEEPKT